ncbi:MAG: PD40 domain-containing protein [Chloroflexi bacterium]|nr:PD40 domain-containing protein [Chloroflexota bacterium]
MTPFLNKHRNTLLIAGTALVVLGLSACGGNIDLSGAAGAGETTEEASATPTEAAPILEEPTATPIPPATGKIIFASKRDGNTELYMTSPDGLEVTRLSANAGIDSSATPRLSPDGAKIAFSATIGDNTDIYILDIASGLISRVTDAPGKDVSPSWSPNGQQLAFASFRDGNYEIYIVNSDGSHPIRLTNDSSGDTTPIWSPVSNEIVFVSNRFGNSDLLLLSLNGAISPLTTTTAPENTPTWSPDGSVIAFQTFDGELANICLIGRDGLNQRCITPYAAKYSIPAWSQDSQWIAYHDYVNIQMYNLLDNSTVTLSQPGIEPRGILAWSPDGLRLVFQAEANGDMDLYHALIPTNEFTRITAVPGYDGEPVWASR